MIYKKNFGELINKGLTRIGPLLNNVVDFITKFVDTAISGEKATGRFAGGINTVIKVFKALTFIQRTVAKGIGFVADRFPALQAAAKQGIENVKLFFVQAVISAEIARKKLALTFTIGKGTRNKLKGEIEKLKELRTTAADAGQTIGEAYFDALDEQRKKREKGTLRRKRQTRLQH